MKIFAFLSIFASAEALTTAQQNYAKSVFKRYDHDHNGALTSGGVYTALSQLDHKLTEAQLQKAAGHNKKKVTLSQFLNIYAKIEGSTLEGGSKYPKGCKNWFDGCNHCILKDGKSLGCTKMYCGQMYDGPKKKPFCTVFEDGRRCKSATSCKGSAKKYNCYTREVWTAAKKAYCCKTHKMGCAPTKTHKKPLKAGSVCYAFYESNPAANVNRKTECPKGYKCASTPGLMSFNSIMHCQKGTSSVGSSSTIPKDCTSWYDGCNTCYVKAGKKLGCTRRACFRKGKARCLRKSSGTPIHYEK